MKKNIKKITFDNLLQKINDNYDEGNIISQTRVKLAIDETPESLSKKVQEIEKIQLINVLKNFINLKN